MNRQYVSGALARTCQTHLDFECTCACKEFTVFTVCTTHDFVRVVCHVLSEDQIGEQVFDNLQPISPYQTDIPNWFIPIQIDRGGLPLRTSWKTCKPTEKLICSPKRRLCTGIELCKVKINAANEHCGRTHHNFKNSETWVLLRFVARNFASSHSPSSANG